MSSKDNNHSTKHIIQSLVVNLLITLAKAFAAFMTKSGSMLAETIHSFADCGNQGLLLMGVKQAQKAPNAKHPMGYGRSVYFWSFMVAMMLFSLGGMFSIYEGVHKIQHPEKVENVMWGVGILLFSICLEGYSAYSNVVELNIRRKERGFFQFLKETKDSDLVVIFGENSAAVVGLVFALIALLASYYTGDGRYDGIGSLAIGIVLVGVAIFLAKELKPLLIGESADIIVTEKVQKIAEEHPQIKEILNCITIQQGPGEILMCVKIVCEPNLNTAQISDLINDFELRIRTECSEVRWLYVEPDLRRG
ncbi:cation diffusion facilitator family transporter [soil metagenome]